MQIPRVEGLDLRLLDDLREGCQIIDHEYRYLYLNNAAAAHGRRQRGDLLGRTMLEVYPGIESTEMFALLRACLEGREARSMENLFAYPDGTSAWFDLRFEPVPLGAFVLSLDISQRKNIEQQLAVALRLESVGRVAAGVAHDFNNLLTVVLANASSLLAALAPGTSERLEVEEIVGAVSRATALTRQLLVFSKSGPARVEVLSINAVVDGMGALLRRFVGERVGLTVLLGEDAGCVKATRTLVEQVVMNLVVNARDAMPSGGHLTLATSRVDLEDAVEGMTLPVAAGAYVCLRVSDSGTGIDRDVMHRMFEPFFTTKEAGKGTGLGLATVLRIMKESGGGIWVYSEPGRGTTFKLYWPLAALGQSEPSGPPSSTPPRGAGERVLLVEDEPGVRAAARRLLVAGGYEVIEAARGDEALPLLLDADARIDVLVTDVVMPVLGGVELAARARQHRPLMPIVFMSGYAGTSLEEAGALASCTLVDKPFTAASLLRAVRDALGRREVEG